jgi:hypothetical protein
MRIERDGAAPKASAAVVVLLAALSGVPAAAAEPTQGAPILRNQVDAMTRAALERAGEGALRRLQDPECQQVFSDFRDAEGRPLQEKLEATGQTGAGYLSGRIFFADGSGARACQSSENLAVTNPGSAVVFANAITVMTVTATRNPFSMSQPVGWPECPSGGRQTFESAPMRHRRSPRALRCDS